MKRLAAVITGCLIFGIVAFVYLVTLPQQKAVNQEHAYEYAVNDGKLQSPEFVAEAMKDRSVLLLGSSELFTEWQEEFPANILTEHNYGFSTMLLGRGHTQCLQHAIEVGALDPSLKKGDTVVLLLSPQWFETEGIESGAFQSRFSWEPYYGFMENPDISEATKSQMLARMLELGVASEKAEAPLSNSLLDSINYKYDSFVEDIAVRRELQSTRKDYLIDSSANKPLETPAWDMLVEIAKRHGKEACTNNEYGIYDDYFDTYIRDDLGDLKGSRATDTFINSKEYQDLQIFIQVCKETELNPLIVILPYNGAWLDYTGNPQTVRDEYYETVRSICDEADIEYADFSVYEDEKYFLCDAMHVGWNGWIQIEKAIYERLQQVRVDEQ